MAADQRKRTRSERVAALDVRPGWVAPALAFVREGHVLVRLGLCGLAAVMIWIVARAWQPPFAYRTGYVPSRDIVARIEFEQEDPDATQEARQKARRRALAIYEQDPVELTQLLGSLQNAMDRIVASETLDALGLAEWKRFELPPDADASEPKLEDRRKAFARFQQALSSQIDRERFMLAVAEAMQPYIERGLIDPGALPPEDTANQQKIFVYPKGQESLLREINIDDVVIPRAVQSIKAALSNTISSPEVTQRVFAWLRPQLPSTLQLDLEATKRAQQLAASQVEPQTRHIEKGHLLAAADRPIDESSWRLLKLEHAAVVAARPISKRVARSLAAVGMFVALYTLCGFYISRREPELIRNLARFTSLLGLVVVTAAVCIFLSRDAWQAEMIPLLLFGMTITIAYHQEIALLLTAGMTLIVVVCIGQGLPQAVVLMAAATGAILTLPRVRSRSKLLMVGACSGCVALLTTLGVGTLESQPLYPQLVVDGARAAVWGIVAGSLMTCVLPFIERWFGVQTEISLIELGDPAHPLLQELIRRAPGTYNHSITVASLAEAAAERIGARGLLVRVGAYYHDIGKMLKPGYFVENQGHGDNRHESLVPAMSTLVIIAHVKDGADLARQHRLPDPIIDFIQQHHGTTLVEYFYRRASEQQEADPNKSEVDESSFRYPGPKPQSKEAGILMLADAVESASRVLVEPTPSRIENLVDEIAMKRLMDGQFDDCGLTLKEVHIVKESLVKSLAAVYHGRVKYPDQRTA